MAELSAEKHSSVKQVYSSESTLQALIALSHAMWQAKKNPQKDRILFFYSNKSLKPNVSALAHLPIRFVRNNPPNQLFLGKDSYEELASFLKKADGSPALYDLYLCDRSMYDDPFGLVAMNAYYMAQARQVVCYEEGTLSYTYEGGLHNPEEKKRLLEEQWARIKKEFPLEAGKNNYERYLKSDLKNSLHASGWNNFNRLAGVNMLEQVATAWQHPESVQVESKATATSKKIHINIKSIYQALSKEEQKDFCKFLNYDIDQMHEKYFKRRDCKKNLVLVGTHFMFGVTNGKVPNRLGNRNLVKWVKEVIKKFGGEYRILYKPHPRYIEPYKKLLQDSGIVNTTNYVLIEESFPLELIELNNGADKYAGALSSALYFEGIAPKTDHVVNLAETSAATDRVWQVFKRMGLFEDSQFKTVTQLQTEWATKTAGKEGKEDKTGGGK